MPEALRVALAAQRRRSGGREVSRLRRVVGALVATNPYRLAAGVSLHLED